MYGWSPPAVSSKRQAIRRRREVLPTSVKAEPSSDAAARIPIRVDMRDATSLALEAREAFAFLHVDGKSSVGDIARMSGMPLDELSMLFESLERSNMVVLTTQLSSQAPPCSSAVRLAEQGEETVRPPSHISRRR